MRATIQNEILILHFEGNRDKMNELLDPFSNAYEGVLYNREGHNFPAIHLSKTNPKHILYQYRNMCKYVIGVYNGKSIEHELLHAKYYLDLEYRRRIEREWNELPLQKRAHIIQFLKRLGYSDAVVVDEYQAYRYSEAPNFFGIKFE